MVQSVWPSTARTISSFATWATADGSFVTAFGVKGRSRGVCVDRDGRILVTESDPNYRVQVFGFVVDA